MTSPVAANPDIALELAVAPLATGNRVYFAARSTGLARSDDGASWTELAGVPVAGHMITTVAASPDVAADRTLFAGAAGGILTSTDLGDSWRLVAPGSPPPLISALAVSPGFHRDGIVLAGTFEDGLYRSTDRGATWRLANVGLFDMSVLAIAISPNFVEDQTVLIGAASGVYLSTTGGRSWRDLDGPEAPVAAVAVSPNFARDGLLLAGTEGAGLFLSRDGGDHWRQAAEHLSETDIVRIQIGNGPAEPGDIQVVTAEGVSRSRSGGTDWITCAADLTPGETIVSAIRLDATDGDGALLIGLASGAIRRIDIHCPAGRALDG